MRKNKFMIIANGLDGGGTERTAVSLANYFADKEYSIIYLALYRENHFYKLTDKIDFVEPDFERKKMTKYAYIIKMIYYVRKYIKLYRPNSILAFNEWTNPYIIFASMGLGIPIYVSDRMHPLAKAPFSTKILKKLLYRRAEGIIAQTKYAERIIREKTKAIKIKVIPNPLNEIKRDNYGRKKKIITVGRLAKVKGQENLIRAFAETRNKEWELSIIGDGEERERLENIAIEKGIKSRVKFHGHLKDFTKELSESQIFVLPSLKEGFPNALIEAMSVPLACISGDFFNGENDIVENGINGILIKPGDVKELINALNLLIENEKIRTELSNNAYKIRETLNFDKIAKLYLEFITDSENLSNKL